jgi:phosphotriesterase-related protein
LAVVQGVLGPLEREQLGVTLTHEHLFIGWPGWDVDSVAPDQKVAQYPILLERLRAAQALGVRTIVDAGPAELGRDVAFLQQVARASGLNVIASTGFYHEAWGLPVYLKMRSVQELTEILLSEIVDGIGPEKVHAGTIKVASSGAAVGKHERKALLAAAAAAKETGTSVLTHASSPEVAREQAETLVGAGVRPGSVQIGHCDGFPVEALEALARLGVMVAIDQVVYQHSVSLEQRVATVMALLNGGWERHITLSHDQLGILGGRPVTLSSATRDFTYIHETFLPALRAAGLSEAQERRLLCANPADWLCGPADGVA